ncbi:fused MFS/spermidine synthase [Microbulbifer sp. THAF38]|uniref:fused MFS/spermidine synthase n=1 Tax=Microbulbifer sp. THAF38 TaxID=2587856 RepID=UPI001268D4ED|nr:fused MFS/spermidine synthase [Microbulbifer sp. THAF38]QFT57094.1 spermidine synthase [Microbulbifer sp. THAF38]
MTTRRKAAIILLLEGLASSGLQMITIRQTVPFVGSSVLCTSIIISCFLAALALGYYWGGQQASERYAKSLVMNLVGSIALFGIGLSYIFVSFFFLSIADMTQGISYLSNPLIHLFLFSLLVMSPLVFFLGQTVPLLLNTADHETSKSEATGNATALSTIGNVLGCLITSLLLMYFLGVGYSIFINCLILAVCLCLMVNWSSSRTKYVLGTTLSFLTISYTLNVKIPDNLFAATTPYSNYHVADHPDGKRFIINRSSASFIGENDRKGWPYIEIMKQGIFVDDMTGKDILVLGAGGFTLSAEETNGANFTYLDVDPQIKPVAENYFLEEPIRGEFIANDARSYLLTSGKLWDVIVVDLYTNAATIPMHTATYEFFSLVSSSLKPSGKAVLNIAANPRLSDKYSANMDFTVRQALSRCITDITGYQDSLVNIVYFCSKRSSMDDKTIASLYRDNTTKVTVDGYLSTINIKKWQGRGESTNGQ